MNIALLLHISIAFASLAFTGYTYLRPAPAKIKTSYGMVAATFITGTFLLISSPSHMVEACTMGLAFVAITSFGTVAARNKLARQTVPIERSRTYK